MESFSHSHSLLFDANNSKSSVFQKSLKYKKHILKTPFDENTLSEVVILNGGLQDFIAT